MYIVLLQNFFGMSYLTISAKELFRCCRWDVDRYRSPPKIILYQ